MRGRNRSARHGPWEELFAIAHAPGNLSAADPLVRVIRILESIQYEPWRQSLYLREVYLPSLRSLPPEQAGLVGDSMEGSLLASSAEYFTKISCPVLALFGVDDVHLPAHRSAELLRKYVAEGENTDLTIVIFENAGHSMSNFMPTYWNALYEWLDRLHE